MQNKIQNLLFPTQYRNFAYQRLLLNIFRTVHILCIGILIGGFYFEQPVEVLQTWLMSVLLSGALMFMIDLYSSFIYLFEIRGVVILIKILILLGLPLIPAAFHFHVLVVLLIFSSMISHSPRWIRHMNLMPDKFQQKYGFMTEKSRKL